MFKKTNRKKELDTLKFLSIFLIYTTHFIATYKPELFNIMWTTFPTNIFMKGITGKLGVAIFSLLLGYFAYNSGKKESFVKYSVKRYGYFVWAGLFINILISLLDNLSLFDAVTTSLKLGDSIYPMIWCFKDFLIASIIANYLGRNNSDFKICLIFSLLFVLMGEIWISICLLGTILNHILSSDKFKNNNLNFLLMLFLFILIQRPEGTLTYYLYAPFSLILIVFIERSTLIKRILSNNLTSFLGEKTLAILVIHELVYEKLGSFLFANYFRAGGIEMILVWIICFVVICILSIPVTYVFNLFNPLFDKVFYRIKGIVKNNE